MSRRPKRNESKHLMVTDPKDRARRLKDEAQATARRLEDEAEETARRLTGDAMARAFEPLTPERRRAMTRQHLLDAAGIVFARDGFHGASLDDIAATAGFTKGAVYSNFKNKEDLLLAVMDHRISQQFDDIVGALDTDSHVQAEQLPRIANTVVDHIWDDSWTMLWLELVLYAARNPEAHSKVVALTRKSRERIEELVEKEYAVAGAPPRYPSRDIAIISTAMFDGLAIYHLVDPEIAREGTIRTLLQVMYDALGVDDWPSGGDPPD